MDKKQTKPIPTDTKNRFYAYISYEDKEEAKVLGAKWDTKEKFWYFTSKKERFLALKALEKSHQKKKEKELEAFIKEKGQKALEQFAKKYPFADCKSKTETEELIWRLWQEVREYQILKCEVKEFIRSHYSCPI